jgi:hypothetical protein
VSFDEEAWERKANRRLSLRVIRRSRKARVCDECGREIPVGFPAVRRVGFWDTIFGEAFYHPVCWESLMEMPVPFWLRDE